MSNPFPPVTLFDSYWAPTLAFATSLGRRGVPLQIIGRGALGYSRYRKTRRLTCPPVDNADLFLPWLEERVRNGDIARIAPTTDLMAYYISVLREHFPPAVQRTIPSLEETESALLKTRFATACARVGQRIPMMAAPVDVEGALSAAREMGFPVLLKPKSHLVVGHVPRGILATDEESLRRAYRPYPVLPGHSCLADRYPELLWPFLQRYVPSARRCVYSVTGVKDADRGVLVATLTCKREQWPPDVGVSILQESCTDERILRHGVATVDRLVSRGIFELELIADGEELLAIDLNPRAFGFINLDIALGADLPWLWFESTLHAVSPLVRSAPDTSVECRFVLPYYIARSVGWLRGRGPAAGLSRTRVPARRWISMLGDRSDPLPMIASHLRLLRHPGGLVRPYLAKASNGSAVDPLIR